MLGFVSALNVERSPLVFTVCVRELDVLVEKFASPEYAAVMA